MAIETPDFLPIGSVVSIEGTNKKFMIVARGLSVEVDEGKKEYYDYSCVLYPMGLVGEAVAYTNHERIADVIFKGYSDDEDKKLVEEIKRVAALVEIPKGNPAPQDGEW